MGSAAISVVAAPRRRYLVSSSRPHRRPGEIALTPGLFYAATFTPLSAEDVATRAQGAYERGVWPPATVSRRDQRPARRSSGRAGLG
jgi:hypothetical protein